MATDDVWEIYRGSCECGRGNFVVIASEPDHPWARASQRSWDTAIECEDCGRKYVIEHRGRDFLVVLRSDFEQAQQALEAARNRKRNLMNRPEVQVTKQNLIDHLRGLPSKAEAYRQLNAAGFFLPGTQGTFSRHYRNADDWVRQNFHGIGDLIAALRLLDGTRESIFNEAMALEKSPAPPETKYSAVRTLPVHAGH